MTYGVIGLRRSFVAPLKKIPGRNFEVRRGITTITPEDRRNAQEYCEKQLQNGDNDAYLIRRFLPRSALPAYDALRTLNLELARLPETVSNPTIVKLRMQFWRDTLKNVFDGNPPREPISIMLDSSVRELKEKHGLANVNSFKFWLLRYINTRERHMENKPFVSLAALEDYSENTYATLMYMTLASMGLQSVHMDHLASHIGKAYGIVTTLRGIPILAAPSQPIKGPSGTQLGNTRSPALLLPLDVMAEAGLREEDVFRNGPRAEGLQDAVFQVATRAHDHLITAREMLKHLRSGQAPSHDYEHDGEAEHSYSKEARSLEGAEADINQGFNVLVEAVAAQDYLTRLEKANFDPFAVQHSWKLPMHLWRAASKKQI
ncbi:NADH dehydrogenase complex I, assembly factor 6 [Podospora fimiseda]|uniref:NADH dehydrogenase complex I, assembly factor 6 n=1 Tax=Podospora fimiseda TaxID=252190 RepID=A0AAN7H2C6_9PEZI|nr:NADH dehydrogenase complex I, assembly factor 6 [Podospora fimiseda]